jgi:hypothetical protein
VTFYIGGDKMSAQTFECTLCILEFMLKRIPAGRSKMAAKLRNQKS